MLGTYLTSSAVAPLNKEYVEIENPLWCVLIHCVSDDAADLCTALTSTSSQTNAQHVVPSISMQGLSQ